MLRLSSVVMVLALACQPSGGDDASASASESESSTGAEGSCADVSADDEAGPEVTIALVNSGAAPIYVGNLGYCTFTPFQLLAPQTNEGVRWNRWEDCQPACSEPAADCFACEGQGLCNFPAGPIMIAPGGRYELAWAGVVLESVPLPSGCATGQGCNGACSLGSVPPAGVYTLRTSSSAMLGCDLPDPQTCACMPNAQGWCSLGELGSVIAPVETDTPLDYPNQLSIDIELGV